MDVGSLRENLQYSRCSDFSHTGLNGPRYTAAARTCGGGPFISIGGTALQGALHTLRQPAEAAEPSRGGGVVISWITQAKQKGKGEKGRKREIIQINICIERKGEE